jgi:hypothetical protein
MPTDVTKDRRIGREIEDCQIKFDSSADAA